MLWRGQAELPSRAGLGGALDMGLFEMGLTFLLWLAALRSATHVSRVGNLIFLSPFLSLLFIRWLLDEPIAPATFVGLALIVVAVLYQQRARRRSEPVAAAE